MRSIFFFSCFCVFTFAAKSQPVSLEGKWSTHSGIGVFIYQFSSTGNAIVQLRDDLMQWDLPSTYRVAKDTVHITYDPLVSVENLPGEKSDSLKISLYDANNRRIEHCTVRVFRKGQETRVPLDTIMMRISSRQTIDSICFSPMFERTWYVLRASEIRSDRISVRLNINAWNFAKKGARLPAGEKLLILGPHKLAREGYAEAKQKDFYTLYPERRKMQTFSISEDGLLNCAVRDFGDKYVLMHYRFYKWEPLDLFSVPAGSDSLIVKDHKVDLLSGKNDFQFRIAGNSRPLGYFHVTSNAKPAKLESQKIEDTIRFSAATLYELQDEMGRPLLKGTAQQIDCSSLPDGKYFLSYDRESATITKKSAKKKSE